MIGVGGYYDDVVVNFVVVVETGVESRLYLSEWAGQ